MNFRAWLTLFRVSNLPTVWANTVSGFYIVGGDSWVPCAMLAVVFSLVYVAGMAMNDLVDRNRDRVEKPTRPLPAGQLGAKEVRGIVIVLFGAALLGLELIFALHFHRVAWPPRLLLLTLIGCVILYNLVHHLAAASIVLLAGCRALIVLGAAATAGWWLAGDSPWPWGLAATLAAYVLALSAIARGEDWITGSATGNRGFTRRGTVAALLAAMPLVDAAWLFLFGYWPAACFCIGCAVLTRVWHRSVSGT